MIGCPTFPPGDGLEICLAQLGASLDRRDRKEWYLIILAEVLPNTAVPLDRSCTLEFRISVLIPSKPGPLPSILKDNLEVMSNPVPPHHYFDQRLMDGQGFQLNEILLLVVPYRNPGVGAWINADVYHTSISFADLA